MTDQSYAAAVAADVAARYGIAGGVDSALVKRVARGVSGQPLPVWNGSQLIYPEAAKVSWRAQQQARARRDMEDPAVVTRRARVVELHATGLCDAAIAEAMDISINRVRADRIRAKLSPHQDPAEAERHARIPNQIRALLALGYAAPAIGDELGVSANHVRKIIREKGFTLVPAQKCVTRKLAAPVSRRAVATAPHVTAATARRARLQAALQALGRPVARADLPALRAEFGLTLKNLRVDFRAIAADWPTFERQVVAHNISQKEVRAAKLLQLQAMDVAALTTTQIADALGVSLRSTRGYLRELGLQSASSMFGGMSKDQAEAAAQRRARIAEMAATGQFDRGAIADAVGVSPEVVSRAVAELKIKLPRSKANPWRTRARGMTARVQALREQLAALKQAGKTYLEMSAITGKSVATCCAHLGDMGLTAGYTPRQSRVAA